MSELLEFLRTHEEAFRSRARLASLYSDFRYQRNTNPDGYQANSSAWLRALTTACRAGVLPAPAGGHNDRLVIRTSEELARALETDDLGRPLALGAVLQDALQRKELVPLQEFLSAKKSVYAKNWVPTPWQVVSWGLRQLGVAGGETAEDKLAVGNFVVMANVEAATKAVLERVSKTATSNTERIFSRELFASTFSSILSSESLSPTDTSILLTHLSRDRSAISYSVASGTIKFKAALEAQPTPITEEDVTIASLRTLIPTMESQVQELTKRVAELERNAREAVAVKQLNAAKNALRKKKQTETTLATRTATLAQLEDVYAKIEQAADQVEIVRVMEASSKTLSQLNQQTGGVEKVQGVVDSLRDEMANVEEIGNTLNEASAGTVDEGEVDDELEALERVEKEKQEAVEKRAREAREAQEAEETRKKLAELDQLGKDGRLKDVKNEREGLPDAVKEEIHENATPLKD